MKRVFEYVKEHRLIEKGDRIVVGLSGGADSVCLLFVLLKMKDALDLSVLAVHINHNLRGQEALRDVSYVENLCKRLQVPLKVVNAKVNEFAKKNKIGLEEAGRLIRYQAFEAYAQEVGAAKIALAHHQNDLAETMIWHLARGTDLAGLAAMRPMRGKYIRPLLCVSRQEIEKYLEENALNFVTDSTNGEDCYTRNRIRHHVIEYLEKEVNEQTVAHMGRTAESLGELHDYLQAEAGKLLMDYCLDSCDKRQMFLRQELFLRPSVLVGYVIRLAIEKLAGGLKDISREHIGQVRDLVEKEVGKRIHLPYHIVAEKKYDGVLLFVSMKEAQDVSFVGKTPEVFLSVPGATPWNGYHFLCTLEAGNMEEIEEKTYTKWLNYDKIKDNLVLRFRKSGDYIVINDQGGRKKLKDYFIDRKIPQKMRDRVPLIWVGSEVLWVCGYRISEAYKVEKETKTVLKIQLQGGSDHE